MSPFFSTVAEDAQCPHVLLFSPEQAGKENNFLSHHFKEQHFSETAQVALN